jgi:hypothetical protein
VGKYWILSLSGILQTVKHDRDTKLLESRHNCQTDDRGKLWAGT